MAEMNRTATITRKTNETDITLSLDLDGTGAHDIATGVPFLDHLLTHVAVHGLMDLRVSKYISLAKLREGMKIGLFFEAFNLTNRTNFGNRFTGNVRSGNFQTAVGLATTTYGITAAAPFQAQLGFRFVF